MTRVLPAAALLLLAACGQPDVAEAPANDTASAPADLPGAPKDAVLEPETPIGLAPLTAGDIDGAGLSGELACSFASSDRETLLLARGNVASSTPALGAIKLGDKVKRIKAAGGFDGMLRNPSFTSAGATIRIELTGEPRGGGESPPRPANLTYSRADGDSVSIAGQWTCGP